jgi:hypothetical protein
MHLLAAFACVALTWMLGEGAFAQASLEHHETPPITQQDIDAAIAEVKADPNLAQERTVRTLRWRSDKAAEKERKKPTSRSFGWLGDFFTFVAETGRVIVWLALAVVLALLGVLIVRLVREIGPRDRPNAFTAPTHVRDLDIRPESLPDDIGAEAISLWHRGEHRAALALLYRGLLSRLVHIHQIQIRHSSTEGDCLAMARQRLPTMRAEYASLLIRTWQRAVYGAQAPSTPEMESLCNAFAASLDEDLDRHHAERAA